MELERGEGGKFLKKGEELRKVRSIRLTDSLWQDLEDIAKQRCITKTELIEELIVEGINAQKLNTFDKAIQILEEALTLKANAGGAIKEKIREVLKILKTKDK